HCLIQQRLPAHGTRRGRARQPPRRTADAWQDRGVAEGEWTPSQVRESGLTCRLSPRIESSSKRLSRHDRHLERVLADYVRYFNNDRPHQGLEQRVSTGAHPANTNGRIVTTPVLGGLHHTYRRAA